MDKYNLFVVDSYSLPNRQRLSILLATILLAFVIARFVQLPGIPISLGFLGILLSFEININTFIAVIVAGLTASGTDWLIRDHPRLKHNPTGKHWVLPGLTAWVFSFPLSFLTDNSLWWAGFVVAGVVLLFVIVAEYIAADSEDIRQPIASAGLIALSFMLFLIFVVSIRSVGLRLIFMLPAVGILTGLVSLRAINLRLHTGWLIPETVVIVLIATQISAALHYLPVSPISFGLILLGLIYALNTFVVNYAQAALMKLAILESVYILAIVWALAFFLGA
jgi:hypothetical protein